MGNFSKENCKKKIKRRKKFRIILKKSIADKILLDNAELNEKRVITEEMLTDYAGYLHTEEKSRSTIKKYIRDLKKLMSYADGREITKALMIDYKEKLYGEDHYKIASVNSFLVAANVFFTYKEWHDLKIRTYRIQHESFCTASRSINKKEYRKLLDTAREEGNVRLYMILQTLASTGMRASEIRYVTVAAITKGVVEIHNKKKFERYFCQGHCRNNYCTISIIVIFVGAQFF